MRSLEGLWLKRPVRLDNIRVSPQVIDFFSGRSRAAEETGGDKPTLPPSEDWEDQFGPTSDAPPPGFVDSGGNGYVPAGPRAGGGSAWAREGAVPCHLLVVALSRGKGGKPEPDSTKHRYWHVASYICVAGPYFNFLIL